MTTKLSGRCRSFEAEQPRQWQATVVETGLDELIAEGHRGEAHHGHTNGRQAVLDTDASIVCVGTPTGPDAASISPLCAHTIEFIGRAMRPRWNVTVCHHAQTVRRELPNRSCSTSSSGDSAIDSFADEQSRGGSEFFAKLGHRRLL